MNRREIIRMLYIGGQAAIGAELVAIIGTLTFLLLYSDLVADLHTNRSTFEAVEPIINSWSDHQLIYSISTLLISGIPTIAMLIVVWAWHLYFASEGVHLMNWVASSVAIVGATLTLANVGINLWGFNMLYDAYKDQLVTTSEIYVVVTIAESLQIIGSLILYIMYPMLLAFASWQRRLLPKWFLGAALIFVIINDINILYNSQYASLAVFVQMALVLWPFLMGVALLTKANRLNQLHTTTPTH